VSRRRVARIITRLNIGGPSIQAITLSRELEAEGLETCLIHGQLGDAEGDMRTLLSMDGVREEHLTDLRREVSPWHDLRALWRLYRALCAWQPVIVHTHMAKAGALGRLAAVAYNRTAGRRAPARLVHTYHGHVFEGYFGSPSTRVFLFVERWLARHTDVLIAISPQIRTDLLETYRIAHAGQVQIVPLGFSLGRFSAIGARERQAARQALGVPDGTVVVTTVGRLTAIKQHTLFLRAAANVARAVDRVRFLVVGDGELRRALEEEAAAAGIADRVSFSAGGAISTSSTERPTSSC
jgi:glycosyltransferase involved in cell wall biosynthesis